MMGFFDRGNSISNWKHLNWQIEWFIWWSILIEKMIQKILRSFHFDLHHDVMYTHSINFAVHLGCISSTLRSFYACLCVNYIIILATFSSCFLHDWRSRGTLCEFEPFSTFHLHFISVFRQRFRPNYPLGFNRLIDRNGFVPIFRSVQPLPWSMQPSANYKLSMFTPNILIAWSRLLNLE